MSNTLTPDQTQLLHLARALCPTVDDEAPLSHFADILHWSIDRTRAVAEALRDRDLIDTDAGMGSEVTIIEGRNWT